MDFGVDVLVKMLAVFVLGLAPIAEVRGALPLAYKLFMVDSENSTLFAIACIFGVLGNLIIAPLVLFALDKLESLLLESTRTPKVVKKLYLKVILYVRRRAKKHERIEMMGLIAFVAVPLPFTGAWTGSLIAYVLGLNKRKSLVCIELGVLVATAIVLTAIALLDVSLRVFGIDL